MDRRQYLLCFFFLCLISGDQGLVRGVVGLACNWGTQSTHPLEANIAVKLLKDNGFNKVKLFEADPAALKALGKSGIQVMVGIPNEFLAPLASSVQVAVNWVQQNVSSYVSRYGTDIRYVAVGNEPFLQTFKDTFLNTTFPALQNIQAALIKAGLGRQVKVTVPLNADVYQTESGLPSGGDFRSDIHGLMISIIKFLSENNAPLTINIYPFLSLYDDPHFPVDYAFFNGTSAPVVDGSISYTNVFEANFDTLISALEKNGFSSMPVIVGEVGWPTDGDRNANVDYARRFNQALVDRINQGQGTPKRKTPPDIYLFALADEDAKSVRPGNFERHWGIFYYDGAIKYQMNMGNGKPLVPAKGVRYLARQWCVMSPAASISEEIEAKYTSRAAELYRQILSKEVAKSMAEEAGLPSSPVTSQSTQAANGLPDVKINDAPKESSLGKQETPDLVRSPKASHSVITSSVKKPLGAKRTGKTGGLGARKLATKPSENLYDQKPEEPALPVTSTTNNNNNNNNTKAGTSFASRFEYIDNVQPAEMISGGPQVISHVSPPKSSSFFAEFGMESGFPKKGSSNYSKVQIQETDEARKKFSNAKSISSAQFFGDQNKADADAQVSLQKFSGSSAISSADLFGQSDDHSIDLAASDLINRISFQAQQDISSLKNIAGETGKKLSSFASTFITDLQDRIL